MTRRPRRNRTAMPAKTFAGHLLSHPDRPLPPWHPDHSPTQDPYLNALSLAGYFFHLQWISASWEPIPHPLSSFDAVLSALSRWEHDHDTVALEARQRTGHGWTPDELGDAFALHHREWLERWTQWERRSRRPRAVRITIKKEPTNA